MAEDAARPLPAPRRLEVRTIDDALLEVVSAIRPAGARLMLGITGAPGSGKSTFAQLLVDALGETAVYLPMDGYHLADVELQRQGLLHRKGAPETFDGFGFARLLAELALRPSHPVFAPAFDRSIEQPIAGSIPVLPGHDIVVTEGNYLLLDAPAWLAARVQLDEVWHIESDDRVRLSRLIERHESFGKSPDAARHWVEDVDQPNARLIQSRSHAADRLVGIAGWVIDEA